MFQLQNINAYESPRLERVQTCFTMTHPLPRNSIYAPTLRSKEGKCTDPMLEWRDRKGVTIHYMFVARAIRCGLVELLSGPAH